jgi:hypothetical protein
MNCNDISRTLDSRDVHTLSAAERHACEAHAASCPQCGPEWVVYTRLAAIPAPVMPPDLAARCEALAATLPVAAIGHRTANRTLLVGAVIVAAAAAAMLGFALRREAQPQVIAGSVAPELADEDTIAVPITPGATPSEREPAAASPGNFAVQLRLQYDSTDALALRRVREYYEALADGLRTVPGLHLVRDEASDAPADFRVTISNPTPAVAEQARIFSEWASTASVEVLRGGNGGTSGPAGNVHVLGMIGDAWRADAQAGVWTRGPLSGACTPPKSMPCSPTEIAERQVMALRKNVFPRDGSVERELEARFLDAAQPTGEREWVMGDLLSMKTTLSDAMVREALARIARPQDASAPPRAAYDRGNLLALLAGQRHPEIVRPLIDLARYDSDIAFRIKVVSLLAADFPTDPAVRAALEEIAANPSYPGLQNAAAAKLSGLTRN